MVAREYKSDQLHTNSTVLCANSTYRDGRFPSRLARYYRTTHRSENKGYVKCTRETTLHKPTGDASC